MYVGKTTRRLRDHTLYVLSTVDRSSSSSVELSHLTFHTHTHNTHTHTQQRVYEYIHNRDASRVAAITEE